MLSYKVAIIIALVATISALVASPARPLLADLLPLLLTLVLLHTSILDSVTLNFLILLDSLPNLLSHWHTRRREARALDHDRLEERPRRKVDFTPQKIPNDHERILPGDPNEQFHYDTRSKIWDKPIKHLTPASPEISSYRPATPARPIARYDLPRRPETPEPRKPLTPAENAKANLAKKKLFETINKPTFNKNGVMLHDDDLEQHHIKELSASTGLNAKDSRACLDANGWKFDVALKDFRRLAMIDDLIRRTGLQYPIAKECLFRTHWNLDVAIEYLEWLWRAGQLHAGLFDVPPPALGNTSYSTAAPTSNTAPASNAAPTNTTAATTSTPLVSVIDNQILKKPSKYERLTLIQDWMTNMRDYWRPFKANDCENTCPSKGEFKGDCGQIKYEMTCITEVLMMKGSWDEKMINKYNAAQYLLRQNWYKELAEKLNQCIHKDKPWIQEAVDAMVNLERAIPESWGLQWK